MCRVIDADEVGGLRWNPTEALVDGDPAEAPYAGDSGAGQSSRRAIRCDNGATSHVLDTSVSNCIARWSRRSMGRTSWLAAPPPRHPLRRPRLAVVAQPRSRGCSSSLGTPAGCTI